MPSTTPSNSRRRTSSTRGTPEAFSASSTTGATTSTAVVGLPPASWIACSDAVLITIAPRLATPAPHADGNASSGGGSASYRWSQRKAATTPRTGTAASAAPVTTPRTPVTRLISAIVRRAQPPVTSTTAAHTSAGRNARRAGAAGPCPAGRPGGTTGREPLPSRTVGTFLTPGRLAPVPDVAAGCAPGPARTVTAVAGGSAERAQDRSQDRLVCTRR